MNRRLSVIFSTLLTASMLVAGCGLGGNSGSTGSSSGPIKIGVPGPMSGDYASAGEDIYHAAQLAADEINKQGGLLGGRKVEVVKEDDQCNSQIGSQTAQKLVADGVVAVAGGYCSGASIPETKALESHHIAFVADASTNPKLTESGYTNIFRVIGRDDQQGPTAASFWKNVLKAQTVAIIHDGSTYAKGLADAAKQGAQDQGINVVYFDAITPHESDYTSTVTAVMQKHPDVVYFTGYFAEAGLLVKEFREQGYQGYFMGGDATNDPTVIKTAGDKANGMMLTTAPLAKFIPAAKDFVSNYKTKYNTSPGPYAVYEWDCVMVVADAIKRANSANPADIVKALHNTKNYKGLTGTITFDKKGDRTGKLYMVVKIVNGQFEPYMKFENGKWVKAS